MTEPTPDELRAALARLLGWHVPDVAGGCYFVRRPDGRNVRWKELPDAAADLNAMATVEAVLVGRGMGQAYANAVYRALVDAGGTEATGDLSLLTAPAAVRALAAYRVLTAHDALPRP